MTPISKNRIKLIILGAILLVIVIFLRIPIIILSINNGNSTEVAPNIGDTGSLTLSTASFIVSLIALVLTYHSLKITQATLKRAEIELQKREIEQRLELFYYPMSYYFKIERDNELKDGMNDEDRRVRVRAYSHRFKADDRTKNEFQNLYLDKTYLETGNKSQIKDDLIKHIDEDIEKYNNKIQDLDNQLQAMAADNESKKIGSKKKSYNE